MNLHIIVTSGCYKNVMNANEKHKKFAFKKYGSVRLRMKKPIQYNYLYRIAESSLLCHQVKIVCPKALLILSISRTLFEI